jgi:hypothetical protein
VIGLNRPLTGNFWQDFFTQGGSLSRALNMWPGANAVAGFHDTPLNGAIPFNLATNLGTIPAAIVVTYGALVNTPLTNQIIIDDRIRRTQ